MKAVPEEIVVNVKVTILAKNNKNRLCKHESRNAEVTNYSHSKMSLDDDLPTTYVLKRYMIA
jgi:hypothetical protein